MSTYPGGHAARGKPCNFVLKIDSSNTNDIHHVRRIVESAAGAGEVGGGANTKEEGGITCLHVELCEQ